ncbi:MAG: family intrarane metalloprotease [Chitinophagaceae bacterium]|nr:family intrarane metalloprotease [Chitinophagaceae bacterium]
MNNERDLSAGAQLGILLMLCGVGLLLGGFVMIYMGSQYMHVPFMEVPKALLNNHDTGFQRLLQGVGAFVSLGIPALLFGIIASKKPFEYLGFNNVVSGKQVFVIVLLLVPASMLTGSLGELTRHIPLSAELTGKFKALEDAYMAQVMVLANMKTSFDLFLSLLILALLPAIFEEMLFRGGFQQMFMRLFKNIHVAIIVTSVVFSAFHVSFYGFLPRLFLGVALGYIFYYSRNLWLNILFHFLNNALVIVQMYILTKQGRLTTKAMDESAPLWYGLAAIPILLMLFVSFRKESHRVAGYVLIDETDRDERRKNKEENE